VFGTAGEGGSYVEWAAVNLRAREGSCFECVVVVLQTINCALLV
jgi:hypothetical protein